MAAKFISLKCQSCGAPLDVYEDMTRFACGFCGSEMFVERRGGTVILKPVVEAIQKVQVGTDKTAAELALARLTSRLDPLRSEREVLRKPRTTAMGCLGVFAVVLGLIGLAYLDKQTWGTGIVLLTLVGVIIWGVSSTEAGHKAKLRAFDVHIGELNRQISENEKIVRR